MVCPSISVDIDCNGFFLVVLSLLLSCCVVDGSGCVVSGEESDGESILFHNLLGVSLVSFYV